MADHTENKTEEYNTIEWFQPEVGHFAISCETPENQSEEARAKLNYVPLKNCSVSFDPESQINLLKNGDIVDFERITASINIPSVSFDNQAAQYGILLEKILLRFCRNRGVMPRSPKGNLLKKPKLSDYNQSLLDNDIYNESVYDKIKESCNIRNQAIHSHHATEEDLNIIKEATVEVINLNNILCFVPYTLKLGANAESITSQ